MRLREQIPPARDLSVGTHKLINLGKLNLPSIDRSNLSKEEALRDSIEEAQKKHLSGYRLNFKQGNICVICIKAADIPKNHPQIVSSIKGTTYHIMKSHAVV